MTPSDREALYRQAIDKWGSPAQLAMLYEEIGELMVAIGHLDRGRTSASAVIGEVADVRIMLEQIEVIVGDGVGASDAVMTHKLQRLAARLSR